MQRVFPPLRKIRLRVDLSSELWLLNMHSCWWLVSCPRSLCYQWALLCFYACSQLFPRYALQFRAQKDHQTTFIWRAVDRAGIPSSKGPVPFVRSSGMHHSGKTPYHGRQSEMIAVIIFAECLPEGIEGAGTEFVWHCCQALTSSLLGSWGFCATQLLEVIDQGQMVRHLIRVAEASKDTSFLFQSHTATAARCSRFCCISLIRGVGHLRILPIQETRNRNSNSGSCSDSSGCSSRSCRGCSGNMRG